MTRHLSREEREQEILEAAAAEVDESGYRKVTMDAVAARTSVSKGAIYRYFASKKDLALALFARSFVKRYEFDLDEALAWGLPMEETYVRLTVTEPDDPSLRRWERVWIQLLPEAIYEDEFQAIKDRLQAESVAQYRDLTIALVERDGLRMKPDFRERLEDALRLGTTVMEGLAFQRLVGRQPPDEQAQVKNFIEIMVHDGLEPDDA